MGAREFAQFQWLVEVLQLHIALWLKSHFLIYHHFQRGDYKKKKTVGRTPQTSNEVTDDFFRFPSAQRDLAGKTLLRKLTGVTGSTPGSKKKKKALSPSPLLYVLLYNSMALINASNNPWSTVSFATAIVYNDNCPISACINFTFFSDTRLSSKEETVQRT